MNRDAGACVPIHRDARLEVFFQAGVRKGKP